MNIEGGRVSIGESFEALLDLCEQRVAINNRLERETGFLWVVSFDPYGGPERWVQESHVDLSEALRRAVSVSQAAVFNGCYIDSPHKGSERSRPAKVCRVSEAGGSFSSRDLRGEQGSL